MKINSILLIASKFNFFMMKFDLKLGVKVPWEGLNINSEKALHRKYVLVKLG